jgi:hypothetical protein
MIEHLCAIIILGVNRRRSICNDLNTRVAQLQIFFAYYFFTFDWFRSSRLVSIEGDRRLEGSSAQHANVYLIHVRDVYVWGIGVRYIYLISVILNVYGGYTYIRRFSATVSSFAPVVSYRSHTLYSI